MLPTPSILLQPMITTDQDKARADSLRGSHLHNRISSFSDQFLTPYAVSVDHIAARMTSNRITSGQGQLFDGTDLSPMLSPTLSTSSSVTSEFPSPDLELSPSTAFFSIDQVMSTNDWSPMHALADLAIQAPHHPQLSEAVQYPQQSKAVHYPQLSKAKSCSNLNTTATALPPPPRLASGSRNAFGFEEQQDLSGTSGITAATIFATNSCASNGSNLSMLSMPPWLGLTFKPLSKDDPASRFGQYEVIPKPPNQNKIICPYEGCKKVGTISTLSIPC